VPELNVNAFVPDISNDPVRVTVLALKFMVLGVAELVLNVEQVIA
jgi:hypothetical protein